MENVMYQQHFVGFGDPLGHQSAWCMIIYIIDTSDLRCFYPRCEAVHWPSGDALGFHSDYSVYACHRNGLKLQGLFIARAEILKFEHPSMADSAGTATDCPCRLHQTPHALQ